MTDAGHIPDWVLERAATRLSAHTRTDLCTKDGCDELGTQSAAGRPGRWCDAHYPWHANRNPTPDPTATADALYARRIREADARRTSAA